MPKKATQTSRKDAPKHTRINNRTIKAQFRKPPVADPVPLKVEESPIIEEAPIIEEVEDVVAEEIAEEEPSVEEAEEKLDLTSMTKKQLIAVAQKEKVTYKNLSKAELLEALQILLD